MYSKENEEAKIWWSRYYQENDLFRMKAQEAGTDHANYIARVMFLDVACNTFEIRAF